MLPAGVLRGGENQIELLTPALSPNLQISFLHSLSASYTRTLDGSQPLEVVNAGR